MRDTRERICVSMKEPTALLDPLDATGERERERERERAREKAQAKQREGPNNKVETPLRGASFVVEGDRCRV